VVVDTPSLGPHDDPAAVAAALESQSAMEKLLVLPATAKASDLLAMVKRFASLRPARIAFTHLDESTRNGNLLTVTHHSRLPITFLSSSQSVEQLEIAMPDRLVSLVLGDQTATSQTAARSRHAARGSSS
jgi:flagellar biosynthesis GTPase FlhF